MLVMNGELLKALSRSYLQLPPVMEVFFFSSKERILMRFPNTLSAVRAMKSVPGSGLISIRNIFRSGDKNQYQFRIGARPKKKREKQRDKRQLKRC